MGRHRRPRCPQPAIALALPLLLDTCAVLWLAEGEELAAEAASALNAAHDESGLTFLSPITAWEIGLLASRGRLTAALSPQAVFQMFLDAPHIRLAGMGPDVLIASSFLPGDPPRDPADRILAATAREFGYALVTRDRRLLAYGSEGHIQTIKC